jgi:hypothetical protein
MFVLLVFNFWSSLCILDINLLSTEELAKIFSHSVGCPLILAIVSLWHRSFLFIYLFIYLFMVLDIEPRASCMLGNH